MSNPLSMFRKHQYIFLVVFGVMLMVAFIVLPPLDDYLRSKGGPGSGANPVVVSWKGGQFRETELDRLREMHRVAVSYLFAICLETKERDGSPRGVRQTQFGQIQDPGIPSNMSDESLVHTHLLASKGEAMGLVISDQAIVEFLEQLSDDKIPANEMGRIFKENLANKYSEQQLLNQLRIELMAQRVRSMAEAGLYVAPYGTVQPVQAWDYFKRLNRRAKIEAVAINVDSFVGKVKEPTEAQLKTLYEVGKSRFHFPQSPEPGFHKRRKAAFQYVKADLNTFLEEEKAKITISDEEIEKHYEENKAIRYKELELPDSLLGGGTTSGEANTTPKAADPDAAPAPPKEDPAPAPDGDPGKQPPAKTPGDAAPVEPKKPTEPQPAEPKPAEPKPAEPKPAEPKPTEPKPTEPRPTEPKPTEPKPTEPKPTEPKPTEPKPATDGPGTDPKPPASPGEARKRQNSRLFFVSTQAEESQPAADPPAAASTDSQAPTTAPATPKPDDPASQPKKPADPKPADPKPADPKPTDPKPTDPKPTDPKPAPEKTPAPVIVTEAPAAGTPAAPPETTTPPVEAEPPKLRPLDDELRQEIRDELTEIQARRPARERLDAAMAEIRNLVSKLGREKRKQLRAANPDDDDVEPSGPVDIDAVAAKHGLTVMQIPLVDAIEVSAEKEQSDDDVPDGQNEDPLAEKKPAEPMYELGAASNMQLTSWPPTQQYFAEIAFTENERRYSPTKIGGSQEIEFLYWKIDGEEPYIPDFAEAMPEVKAAWKLIEARKIAENEAKNLKDELAKGTSSLESHKGDGELIAPREFSWMTTGFNPSGAGTPEMSTVEGIESVGQDFMKEVFSLKPGEFGTAMNIPKSKVYVFRLVSDSPPDALLKQLFLTSGSTPEVQYIAYVESIELLREWYSHLETEMNVTWNRDPADAT